MNSPTDKTLRVSSARPPSACPRCGYDQSGIVASWRDSCPLEGKCSECGLEFAWADVLNPQLAWPRWSFEHARKHLVWSYLCTVFMALLPRRFFAGIRMEHPIRFDRLAMLLVICPIVLYFGFAAIVAAIQYKFYRYNWGTPGPPSFTLADVGKSALWPYADGETLWYALRSPTTLGIALGAPIALLMPLAFLLLPATFRRMKIRVAHVVRVGIYALVAPAIFWSMLMVVWAAYETLQVHFYGNFPRWLPSESLTGWMVAGGSPLLALWAPYFWWRAGKQYLKLPRSLFVVIMLAIVTGLLTIVLWAYIPWLIRQIG